MQIEFRVQTTVMRERLKTTIVGWASEKIDKLVRTKERLTFLVCTRAAVALHHTPDWQKKQANLML